MASSQGLEWFRPMWRRVAITGLCVGWCLFEWFWSRDSFWGMLTLALVAYAVWTFFITYDKVAGPPPLQGKEDGKNLPPPGPPAS